VGTGFIGLSKIGRLDLKFEKIKIKKIKKKLESISTFLVKTELKILK
jgi:hypothetical protein